MAEIRPFKGLRYSAASGPINKLVAPPYDVLTPAERNGYAARSEYNIVHLTLPEGKIDDRSKFVKYARSSALLGEWRRNGVLSPDETPSFYRYTQSYEIGADYSRFSRTSLLCLIKVEPFERGMVLPHEQTFPSHKEDRLRLLESTRTHLESIFGVYEDLGGSIHQAILNAPTGALVKSDSEGLTQSLEPIFEPDTVRELQQAFVEKRIWIADGHHRYETALGYRQTLPATPTPIAEDYMVIALASIADPGLILMPTHRVVPSLKHLRQEDLEDRLGGVFATQRCHSSRLAQKLAESERSGDEGIGIALEGGQGLWAVPRDLEALAGSIEDGGSPRLRRLGSTLLHKIILQRLLGVPSTAQIEFTHEAARAITICDQGGGAAFLVSPPSIEDMQQIALSGERMPHKSTYYYPKIWSGFVAWGFEDYSG